MTHSKDVSIESMFKNRRYTYSEKPFQVKIRSGPCAVWFVCVLVECRKVSYKPWLCYVVHWTGSAHERTFNFTYVSFIHKC